MGRRGIKEYRAAEALLLIAADRARQPLTCPSCGNTEFSRTPPRADGESGQGGRVTLKCSKCGRSAVYVDLPAGQSQAG